MVNTVPLKFLYICSVKKSGSCISKQKQKEKPNVHLIDGAEKTVMSDVEPSLTYDQSNGRHSDSATSICGKKRVRHKKEKHTAVFLKVDDQAIEVETLVKSISPSVDKGFYESVNSPKLKKRKLSLGKIKETKDDSFSDRDFDKDVDCKGTEVKFNSLNSVPLAASELYQDRHKNGNSLNSGISESTENRQQTGSKTKDEVHVVHEETGANKLLCGQLSDSSEVQLSSSEKCQKHVNKYSASKMLTSSTEKVTDKILGESVNLSSQESTAVRKWKKRSCNNAGRQTSIRDMFVRKSEPSLDKLKCRPNQQKTIKGKMVNTKCKDHSMLQNTSQTSKERKQKAYFTEVLVKDDSFFTIPNCFEVQSEVTNEKSELPCTFKIGHSKMCPKLCDSSDTDIPAILFNQEKKENYESVLPYDGISTMVCTEKTESSCTLSDNTKNTDLSSDDCILPAINYSGQKCNENEHFDHKSEDVLPASSCNKLMLTSNIQYDIDENNLLRGTYGKSGHTTSRDKEKLTDEIPSMHDIITYSTQAKNDEEFPFSELHDDIPTISYNPRKNKKNSKTKLLQSKKKKQKLDRNFSFSSSDSGSNLVSVRYMLSGESRKNSNCEMVSNSACDMSNKPDWKRCTDSAEIPDGEDLPCLSMINNQNEDCSQLERFKNRIAQNIQPLQIGTEMGNNRGVLYDSVNGNESSINSGCNLRKDEQKLPTVGMSETRRKKKTTSPQPFVRSVKSWLQKANSFQPPNSSSQTRPSYCPIFTEKNASVEAKVSEREIKSFNNKETSETIEDNVSHFR